MSRTRLTRRSVLLLVFGICLAIVVFDYVTYHSRFKTAICVAQAHGARVGSLLDWPLGRECRIAFDQPIDRDAVRHLAVLNSLSSRHSVGVAFNYDISDADLEYACEILSQCQVFRVEPLPQAQANHGHR